MNTRRLTAIVIAMLSALATAHPTHAGAPGDGDIPGNPSEAIYRDRTLDLAESWEDATACIELGDHTRCYRTEAELLRTHPQAMEPALSSAVAAVPPAAAGSSCSSSLRLYRWTSYGGGALYLTSRGLWHNLWNYGFDNDTSSYKVGGCSSVFRSGSSGGGSTYPGPTWAWAKASSMYWGWNNVVSSVYIY